MVGIVVFFLLKDVFWTRMKSRSNVYLLTAGMFV